MDLDPRDLIVQSVEGVFYDSLDPRDQRLSAFDVVVGIDLNLHGDLRFQWFQSRYVAPSPVCTGICSAGSTLPVGVHEPGPGRSMR